MHVCFPKGHKPKIKCQMATQNYTNVPIKIKEKQTGFLYCFMH